MEISIGVYVRHTVLFSKGEIAVLVADAVLEIYRLQSLDHSIAVRIE